MVICLGTATIAILAVNILNERSQASVETARENGERRFLSSRALWACEAHMPCSHSTITLTALRAFQKRPKTTVLQSIVSGVSNCTSTVNNVSSCSVLLTLKKLFTSNIINFLLTLNVRSLCENLKPRPCNIDLTIRQGLWFEMFPLDPIFG